VASQYSTPSIAENRQQWREGQLGVSGAEPSVGPADTQVLDIPGAFCAGGPSNDEQNLLLDDDNSEHLENEEEDYLVSATVVEEEPERQIVPAVLIEKHQQDAEQQLSSALDELEKVRKKDAARRRMSKVVLVIFCFVIIIVVIAVVVAMNKQEDNNDSGQMRPKSIKLMASVETADDGFGGCVAIDANGTTIAIAAINDNGSTGSVYIFTGSWEEDGGPVWRQDTKVTASDARPFDYFGSSVALSMDGGTLLVGAHQRDNNGGGYMSVFTRTQNAWIEQAKLLPENSNGEELFGTSVAISQDTIVVGAPIHPNGIDSGSIYVFTQSEGAWNQEARLSPENVYEPGCAGNFGVSVATSLDGNIVVVGDDGCAVDGIEHGNAYVFERTSEGFWMQEAMLVAADIQPEDDFGWSVDISKDGTTIVAGSPGDDDVGSPDSGSVYIFKKFDGIWNENAKLTASDKGIGVMLGQSIRIDSDAQTIVVGAHGPRKNGSGYVFTLSGDWTEKAKLISPDSETPTYFGVTLALSPDGRTAIFGAQPDVTGVSGSAYIFQL